VDSKGSTYRNVPTYRQWWWYKNGGFGIYGALCRYVVNNIEKRLDLCTGVWYTVLSECKEVCMSLIKKLIDSAPDAETDEEVEEIVFWFADWKGVDLSEVEKEKIRKAIKERKSL